MENFPYNSSYPDSVNSSPRSREVDLENSSWDEPISNSNYKVKFMCSYGGKIHPRPHDNQLTYVGGDTKILSVDRNTKYSGFISKLSSLCDASEVYFKYQLPGEDLDALISVTNDEDLEHMMLEHDRLYRSSAKPARVRLFIFPVNLNPASASSFGSDDSKSERQWFVDALNSVQLNQNLEDSSTLPSVAAAEAEAKKDADFLFGLDKSHPPLAQLQDPLAPVAPNVMVGKEFSAGTEERLVIGEPVMSAPPPPEFQRQVQEFQRMQISSHDQQGVQFNRNFDEYYQEKIGQPPPQPHPAMAMANPAAAYWRERQEPPYPAAGTNEPQQVYLIQTPAGVYHAQAPAGMRPVTGQASHQGQPYYGVQRMVPPPEVYREQQQHVQQQLYNTQVIQQQQQKMSGPYTTEGMGLVRPPPPTEAGYGQVGFDSAGRQVYYAAAPPGGLMQPPPQYTAVPPMTGGMDGRQSGGGGGGGGGGGQSRG